MVKEGSYTKAFVVRFWVRRMVGWLISTSRCSVDRVRPTAIPILWSIISKASQAGVELPAYANGLVDRLVIGFSGRVGGMGRLGVCVTTPLTA